MLNVKIDRISYQYRDSDFILDDISFELNSGDILGIVGINGSGKTTMLDTISGLKNPKQGRILINDVEQNLRDFSKQIGYMPNELNLYEYLSLKDNLQFINLVRRTDLDSDDLEKCLEDIGLIDKQYDALSSLSRGMRQKFFYLAVTLHHPQILILDEPFTGLDPIQIDVFGSKLKEYAAEGNLIVFSSHILSFVSSLCNKVLMIDNGEIIENIIMSEKRAKKLELLENLFKKISR